MYHFAIIGGAGWAYFHYFKGRTYSPRLEPKADGKILFKDGVPYLLGTAELRNAGLSKLEIQHEGTALRVLGGQPEAGIQEATGLEWEWLRTLPVFDTHRWIEPAETIREQVLVRSATDGQVAFKMELRIVSSGLGWNTMAIPGVPSHASAGRE